ncbi:MAG TPA: hypothetical protein PLU81_06075 [Deltaproteobacteria bacterium]|nr:hypothetical protein [Deltaproteobacteria bacterium]HPR51336.1 hypothetical protein [Deltaproteobacteria bacterium]
MYNTQQYRIFGIDADCLNIFDWAYKRDPYYLPLELPLPSSIQGFCVCDAETRAPAASFYCFPYVTTSRWRKIKLLRVTRLMLLPKEERKAEKLISHLIKEIVDLGWRAGVHAIEAEVYAQINSRIFFPSTSCAVNTYNTLDWKQILEHNGFTLHRTTNCFEMNVDDLVMEHLVEGIRVREYRSEDEEDMRRYYKVWASSDDCLYDFGHYGFWYQNVFGWPRVWYSEYPHLLNKDEYILFAERNGETVGFIHWWPNIYPLLIKEGRKALYLSREEVVKKLEQIDEAKIFKIAVSRKAKKDRDVIEKALICNAAELMKEKFGIRKCQIGNIPRERTYLKSYIDSQGGQLVHDVCLMRKAISPWGR